MNDLGLTSVHVSLHERSCFPSRAHINYKKVYTLLNFGVHLSGVSCTPFLRKVYTFFNYPPLDLLFMSAREGKHECSCEKT